jgi:hypothetical protein
MTENTVRKIIRYELLSQKGLYIKATIAMVIISAVVAGLRALIGTENDTPMILFAMCSLYMLVLPFASAAIYSGNMYSGQGLAQALLWQSIPTESKSFTTAYLILTYLSSIYVTVLVALFSPLALGIKPITELLNEHILGNSEFYLYIPIILLLPLALFTTFAFTGAVGSAVGCRFSLEKVILIRMLIAIGAMLLGFSGAVIPLINHGEYINLGIILMITVNVAFLDGIHYINKHRFNLV